MSMFKTEKEIEMHVEKMTEDQRDHFKLVISKLIECYTDEEKHAVVLIGNKSPAMMMLSINATEMEAASLLQAADNHMQYRVTEDAPPKEMFN